LNSLFGEPVNLNFRESTRVVSAPSNRRQRPDHNGRFRTEIARIGDYSAAAAKEGFTFADDIMKSEMRGTISDLKREPLKTP
jgi:hypothetical protein